MSEIKNPSFSIVIPVLNEENYIGALLDCLKGQSFKEFEVYIIGGGSKDKTEEVIAAHSAGLDLHYVKAPRNNVSHQRNYGASMIHTPNLIFMDADLYFKEDFLQKVADYIEKHDHIDILSTWLIPNSDKNFFKIVFNLYNRATDATKRWIPVAAGAFMYIKKSVFDDLKGFDETVSIAEDYDLVLRAHKKKYTFELLRDPQVYFSVRRIEKMGKTRYLLTTGKFVLYFPLRSIFKKRDIVGYWKMDENVDSSWKKSTANIFKPEEKK
jgi:glycosyltransferase involved in cell wall biosynthesis